MIFQSNISKQLIILLTLTLFAILTQSAGHTATPAEEANNELGRMLKESENFSDSEIQQKALEIKTNFPNSKEAEFASHIYEMLSTKGIPPEPKTLTSEDLEKRARESVHLIYEDPISLDKTYGHSSQGGRDDSISVTMTQTRNGKSEFNLIFESTTKNWVFFKRIEARCGEKVFTFNFQSDSVHRTVLSHDKVVEIAALQVKGKALKLLECLKSNPQTKVIRFSGQEFNTQNISGVEVEAIQDMLLIKKLVETKKY